MVLAIWYVRSSGGPIGPMTETDVVGMIRAGARVDAVARHGEQWWDPRHHPAFAAAIENPDPPKRKRSPFAQIGLLMGGGVVAAVGVGVCSNAGSARRQKEEAVVASARASAEAMREAERVKRETCPDGTRRRDVGEFQVACEELVKKQLLSPKSADFPGFFDSAPRPIEHDDCSITWTSWVDAKNAFGVELRKNFTCTYKPGTDIIKVSIK